MLIQIVLLNRRFDIWRIVQYSKHPRLLLIQIVLLNRRFDIWRH
jgi:hypothetical protein